MATFWVQNYPGPFFISSPVKPHQAPPHKVKALVTASAWLGD